MEVKVEAEVAPFPSSRVVIDFQFIDVLEGLSSWKVQGIDLENGHFLYFAEFRRGIEVYAVHSKKFVIVLIVN